MNRLSFREKVRVTVRATRPWAMRCSSSGVRISPARRVARSSLSRVSMSRPRPWRRLLLPTMAAAQPVPWVMEPVMSPGQTGARSCPVAGA
ncbi:hypothetical protein D3C81_1924610 [compost metagenome]